MQIVGDPTRDRMGCGGSKTKDELRGQELLGLCWKTPPSGTTQVWVPADGDGALQHRAYELRQSAERNAFLGGTHDRNVSASHSGTKTTLRLMSFDEIKLEKELALQAGVAVGAGFGVNLGVTRRVRESDGSRDVYLVATREMYRLGIDLATGTMAQHHAAAAPASPHGRKRHDSDDGEAAASEPFFLDTAARGDEIIVHDDGTTTTVPAGQVAGYRDHDPFLRQREVDLADFPAFGSGVVTHVVAGGRLIVKLHQTNFEETVKSFGGHVEFGLSAAGPRVGGGVEKKDETGARAVNLTVTNYGGDAPAAPEKNECTVEDVLALVRSWVKGLERDVALAVPLRVGVYQYPKLSGLVKVRRQPEPSWEEDSFITLTPECSASPDRRRITQLERELQRWTDKFGPRALDDPSGRGMLLAPHQLASPSSGRKGSALLLSPAPEAHDVESAVEAYWRHRCAAVETRLAATAGAAQRCSLSLATAAASLELERDALRAALGDGTQKAVQSVKDMEALTGLLMTCAPEKRRALLLYAQRLTGSSGPTSDLADVHVKLASMEFGGDDLALLALVVCRRNPRVVSISLNRSAVGDGGAALVAVAMQLLLPHGRLSHVDLGANRIGFDGAKRVIAAAAEYCDGNCPSGTALTVSLSANPGVWHSAAANCDWLETRVGELQRSGRVTIELAKRPSLQ
jgi:hypothetical protein